MFENKKGNVSMVVVVALVLVAGYLFSQNQVGATSSNSNSQSTTLFFQSVCGNNYCESGENHNACPSDCLPGEVVITGGGGSPSPESENLWTAEYFNNAELQGSPVVTKSESIINYDYATSSPVQGVNSDNFSVRWTGNYQLQTGSYDVQVAADDGVKVYFNGNKIIDEWRKQSVTTFTKNIIVTQQANTFVVEYNDVNNKGLISFDIMEHTGATPSPSPSPTPTPTPSPTPNPSPSPSPSGEPTKSDTPTSGTNLLRNGNFITSISDWSGHTNLYVSWMSEGKMDTGSARICPYQPGSAELWQGRYEVHPGDMIVMEGWVKAGARGTDRPNDGVNLGVDLRPDGVSQQVATLNGPSTLREGVWTYQKSWVTVPCNGYVDKGIDTWYTSDGQSNTINGARFGLWWDGTMNNQYLNKPMPAKMWASPWFEIWHHDSVGCSQFDNLKFTVIPRVISCSGSNPSPSPTPTPVPPVPPPTQQGVTVLSLSGKDFMINGQKTYSGKSVQGTLFTVRAANALFDTKTNKAFFDDYASTSQGQVWDKNQAVLGAWNADANTDRLVSALPSWRAKGINHISVNMQGGCSCSRDGEDGMKLSGTGQTPDNNPYTFDSSGNAIVDPAYLNRLSKIIEAADDNGIVVSVGLVYFGQQGRISGSKIKIAEKMTNWVIDKGYTNVILESKNEDQGTEALDMVKKIQEIGNSRGRPDILATTSLGYQVNPTTEYLNTVDVVYVHTNGYGSTSGTWNVNGILDSIRSKTSKPILITEDGPTFKIANLNEAANNGVGFGYYNDAEKQSVPANWNIFSSSDNSFFNRVYEITGG